MTVLRNAASETDSPERYPCVLDEFASMHEGSIVLDITFERI
jgi:hypothetical protein